MRLIDADALKEDIEQQCALLRLTKDNDELNQISMVLESGFMAQIDKMPTIEPRCETCEAFNKTRLLIPQPERWIPVSERLPDAQTEVVVSCTDDSGDTKFRYTASGWVTTDKEYWIVDNEINHFVVAWREMPEPYKGEQE